MSYDTIDDLRSQLGAPAALSPAYVAKMMHPIPVAESRDRSKFIIDHVTGKRVLEFGATGPMHDAIVKAAAVTQGVDREASVGVEAFDLDDVSLASLPRMDVPDVIVCGELVEHLSNPGWFLTRLKAQYAEVPVIITVPNAFSGVTRGHLLASSIENVNRDHVAWYSYTTLSVLLLRAGYTVREFYYYGGSGPTSQGLIVIAG